MTPPPMITRSATDSDGDGDRDTGQAAEGFGQPVLLTDSPVYVALPLPDDRAGWRDRRRAGLPDGERGPRGVAGRDEGRLFAGWGHRPGGARAGAAPRP